MPQRLFSVSLVKNLLWTHVHSHTGPALTGCKETPKASAQSRCTDACSGGGKPEKEGSAARRTCLQIPAWPPGALNSSKMYVFLSEQCDLSEPRFHTQETGGHRSSVRIRGQVCRVPSKVVAPCSSNCAETIPADVLHFRDAGSTVFIT